MGRRWTLSEIEVLRAHWLSGDRAILPQLLDRTDYAIKSMASRLLAQHNRKPKPWHCDDVQRLRQLRQNKVTIAQLSSEFGRTTSEVKHQLRRMGLRVIQPSIVRRCRPRVYAALTPSWQTGKAIMTALGDIRKGIVWQILRDLVDEGDACKCGSRPALWRLA